ncbi:MAG: hypothetical protein IPM55_14490 [Acidobacteria bacterium]|nr:hypothetical protein [Acidobacteriota bacterium]
MLAPSIRSISAGHDIVSKVSGKRSSRDHATAVVITVQNTGDSGPGSLREAISLATPGDTIEFGPTVLSIGSIQLTSGELLINKDLTIHGPGSGMLTIQRVNGTGDYSIFTITGGATVTIEGLTITNGRAIDSTGTIPEKNDGGGINIINGGNLTLIDCIVTANYAISSGGGISVLGGTLTMYESTISDNNAPLGGGIMAYGNATLAVTGSTISGNSADNTAAIELENSTATLSNSTISGNFSTNGGGAINNAASPGQLSSLTMVNCTVAFNRDHGVLAVATGSGVAETKLKNTIFDNVGAQNFITIGSGAATITLGNNFDGDGTSGFTDGVNGDIVGDAGSPIYAYLGPLADNGGLTKTHALLYGSPAIDAGDDIAAPGVDQRDLSRTGSSADGNADDVIASDIGAFEVQKYLVLGTADSGADSLRQAITDNNQYGGGLIAFDIPVGGVQTIVPSSALPVITRTLTIDGYTQPGSRPNSYLTYDDAILLIELSGVNAGIAEGLELQASDCTVRGLVINGFTNGILIRGPNGFRNNIFGNFIGCDPTGMSPAPNTFAGVNILDGSFSNVIGDQNFANRNLIGGNNGAGVIIQSVNTIRNFVLGNFIGLAADGASNLGNTAGTNPGFGVLIGYGATEAFISNNVIAFNADAGVAVATDASAPAPIDNWMTVNAIYSNGDLGIDLDNDGVTSNDVGDTDAGPNNLQNYPVIDAVTATGVTGSINSTPNSLFRIEFYANSVCDPSGHGQGEFFLGALDFGSAVLTDGSGNASFNFSLTPIPGKPFITATATNNATGNTSEFSACASASPASPPPALSQVSVFDDLVIATGSGFMAPVQVLIDGVGFINPAIVESDGSGVRQTGILSNGKTIAETVVPGNTVQIEIINSGGASTTYSYLQSRSVSSRSLQRRPPIVLTSVVFSGNSVTIEGSLSGLIPNTEYIVYFFYTPLGDSPSTAIKCPETNDPQTIMLTPPITVKTDNFGNSKLFKQVYPAVPGKGFVNAIAVPVNGAPVRLTSNCIGATEPPGPSLFELKVELDRQDPEKDRLIIIGFGFSDAKVSLNEMEFIEPATVAESPTFGQRLIQTGRLRDGRAIRDVIKPGVTVQIKVQNGNGGVTRVQFRN